MKRSHEDGTDSDTEHKSLPKRNRSREYITPDILSLLNALGDVSDSLMTPEEFSAALSLGQSTTEIPDDGTGALRIVRSRLVDEIIATARNCAKKHLWLTGSRGFGKTTLLEQVAAKLRDEGYRVLVASRPDALRRWYASRNDVPEEEQPQYLIVDEVQEGFGSQAVGYLCGKDQPGLLKYITIFAGIPGKDSESSLLSNRWNIDKLLLTADDVLGSEVVQFFGQKMGSVTGRDLEQADCGDAVRKIIQFSRDFTSGHCYPCLKMIEYLVTHIVPTDLQSTDFTTKLLAAVTSREFEDTYQSIHSRCFGNLTNEVHSISNACSRGADVSMELIEKGLWSNGWLLSPLLHKVVLRMLHSRKMEPRRLVAPEEIGKALGYCFSQLSIRELFQCDYDVMSNDSKSRCEDGVSYFVGVQLSYLCEYISPQHGIPDDPPRPGRPPSVDFYVNSTVNMFVEFIKNRSKLSEHFARFRPDGKYGDSKPYVIVDINYNLTGLPAPVAEAQQPHYYTYDVRARVLYDGKRDVVPLSWVI